MGKYDIDDNCRVTAAMTDGSATACTVDASVPGARQGRRPVNVDGMSGRELVGLYERDVIRCRDGRPAIDFMSWCHYHGINPWDFR